MTIPSAGEYLLSVLRSDELPETVYHYTSPRGLLGISKGKQLWATDIRYLNDSEEYAYASSRVIGRLEELRRDASQRDHLPCLDKCVEAVHVASRIRVYVTSFSADGDKLSQWRAYCPASGGFAVGFSPAVLQDATQCLMLPCIYDRNRQDVLVEEVIGYVLTMYQNRRERFPDKQLTFFAAEFATAFLFVAAVLKDPGFREEEEWRLVMRSRIPQDHTPNFREGRSGIVPYMVLPLQKESQALLGLRVRVGPNPHAEIAEEAVEALLAAERITNLGVMRSNIPFRSW